MTLDRPGVPFTGALSVPVRALLRQFAVWTILDDPPRDGFVRLGTFGVGSGPSTKEIVAIRKLFSAAGIDADAYRATR